MTESTEVVVIGGGYAGVMASNRLTQRDAVAVTLINPRPSFVERIRLHQLVGGTNDAVTDYADVLSEGIQLVVDTGTQIAPAERTVTLASGSSVSYDFLIYAVGSASAEPSLPGAAEFAYPIDTLEAAERLRSAVDAAPAAATVTVVGGGSTGIETAAELAETGRSVTLVCGEVLGAYLHPQGRAYVAARLAELGVTVIDGTDAQVTAVTRDAVQLRDGRHISSNVTIWTAGFSVPDLARRSGLSVDAFGRMLTDETLTSVDDIRIVAAGDSASPSSLPFRMSCQAAGPLGAHAADTVLSRIAGEDPAPVNFGFTGQCISLGRGAGIFQRADPDDTATEVYLDGSDAAELKEVVCMLSVKELADEADEPGSHTWLTDDTRQQRLHGQAAAMTVPSGRAPAPGNDPERHARRIARQLQAIGYQPPARLLEPALRRGGDPVGASVQGGDHERGA